MEPIKIAIPKYIGFDAYFKKGRPCCPIGHIMDAAGISIPKKYKDGSEASSQIISNKYEPQLIDRIKSYGYSDAEVTDVIYVSTLINDVKLSTNQERVKLLRQIIQKFPKAFKVVERKGRSYGKSRSRKKKTYRKRARTRYSKSNSTSKTRKK